MAHLALSGDFAMPSRADLMSLQTINKKQDQTNTTTAKLQTIRNTSNNLNTNDIEGRCALFELLVRVISNFITVFLNLCNA